MIEELQDPYPKASLFDTEGGIGNRQYSRQQFVIEGMKTMTKLVKILLKEHQLYVRQGHTITKKLWDPLHLMRKRNTKNKSITRG